MVPVEDAVGRVSAESIAGYPPGIPALLPGERITDGGRRLPARAARLRRAPARRVGPDVPHDRRALRRVNRALEQLVDRALAEDVGDGDATSEATVEPGVNARATITQKAPGVIYGLDVAEAVFARLDPAARIERLGPEGVWREAGAVCSRWRARRGRC